MIDIDFGDIDTTAGRILFDAWSSTPWAADSERTAGEVNGLIRALCLIIDPALYAGTAYSMRSGNSTWASLFQRVRGIVYSDRSAHSAYAGDMNALLREWPRLRAEALTSARANSTGGLR